jgi:hypothetical protein
VTNINYEHGDGTNDERLLARMEVKMDLIPKKGEADMDELKAIMNVFQEKMDSNQEKVRGGASGGPQGRNRS